MKETTEAALERFAKLIDWPPHLLKTYPDPEAQAAKALREYFDWSKGNCGIADFIAQCSEPEIPAWIRDAATKLKEACVPSAADADAPAPPPHPEAPVAVAANGAE